MKRFIAALVLFVGAIVLTGCASTEPEDPNRVSTIPWNTPQRWEGQGPLGGFQPGQ